MTTTIQLLTELGKERLHEAFDKWLIENITMLDNVMETAIDDDSWDYANRDALRDFSNICFALYDILESTGDVDNLRVGTQQKLIVPDGIPVRKPVDSENDKE